MRRAASVLLGAAALSLAAGLVAAPIASASENSDIGISVTTTSAPTPGGTGTSGTGGGTGGGAGSVVPSRSSGGGGLVSTPVGDTPVAPVKDTPMEEVALGGVLYVSGLKTVNLPSLDPLSGSLVVTFTVRNVSAETVDASAEFWMNGPFGNPIGTPVKVAVEDIEANETRIVRASLDGVGQWTFLTAHATFTPPGSIAGIEMTAVTRDGAVFALPWFVFVVLFVAAAGAGIAWVRRSASTGAAVAEPA